MEHDEIKKFMARAMHQVPKEDQEEHKKQLKRIVVDALASKKKVDWSTISTPSHSSNNTRSRAERPAAAPRDRAVAKPMSKRAMRREEKANGVSEPTRPRVGVVHALPKSVGSPTPSSTIEPSRSLQGEQRFTAFVGALSHRPESSKPVPSASVPPPPPPPPPQSVPAPAPPKPTAAPASASASVPAHTPAPRTTAPKPVQTSSSFAPSALSNKLPTPAELSQLERFMQMAQAMPTPPPPFPFMDMFKKTAPAQKPQPVKPAIAPMKMSKEDFEMAEKRKRRFQNDDAPQKRVRPTIEAPGIPSPITNAPTKQAEPVKGTCENLEKQYLRLTSEPKPENVRPKRVLKKSLPYVLKKFEEEGKYPYLVSQMKSIRQDLNVQGIRDGFTVKVYETNARIALQNRDLGEFNQCLSRLTELYEDPVLSFTLNSSSGEFISYHIYYILYTQAYQDLDIVLNKIQLNEELRTSPDIKATLLLVDAFLTQNSVMVFSLYNTAEPLAKLAMGDLVKKERVRCLAALTKSLRKSVIPLDEVASLLGFSTKEESDEFVKSLTAHITKDNEIECATAIGDFERAWTAATKSKIDIKGQI